MPKGYTRSYYERNWSAAQIRMKRYFCKKNNLPFNITKEDVTIPDVCPVLGIALQINESSHNKPNSPSIDRLIPELGYTKGNVSVISLKANRIKNDASLEELEKVYLWLKNQLTV
jgi:hypothetical protein